MTKSLYWVHFIRLGQPNLRYGLRSDGAVFRYHPSTIDGNTGEEIKSGNWEQIEVLETKQDEDQPHAKWIRWIIEEKQHDIELLAFRSDGSVFRWSQCPMSVHQFDPDLGHWIEERALATPQD